MADLSLSIVSEPSDDLGFLAGLAVGGDLIIAVGGTGADSGPTVLASSNARDFETRSTPEERGLRAAIVAGDEVWVCGERGRLARSKDHGATWEAIETGTEGCLFGLARAADGAIWVVGEGGFAARVTAGEKGDRAEKIDLKTDAGLAGVVVQRDAIVILGLDGNLRRWAGGEVAVIPTGSDKALTGLVVTRGAWIVIGDGGFVARSPDGAWWSRVKVDLDADLEAIAALADGTLVAVGDRGLVCVSRDDGRTWATVASEITAHLWSVVRFGGGVLIGGDEGLIAKLAPAGDDAWAERPNVFGGARPMDAAFVAGPLGFIAGGGLQTYLELLPEGKAEGGADGKDGDDGDGDDGDDEPKGDADEPDADAFAALDAAGTDADFETNYGAPLPPEAAAFRALTAKVDPFATFAEFRLDNPLRPDVGDGNLFELMVRRNQHAYLGTDLVEAFCGVFGLGTLGNGDSYHMEIYEFDGPRQVLHFDHETAAFSQVVADSLDSLVYLTAIVKAGDEHLLAKDAYRIGLRKLRGKVAPPWHFAIEDKDPDFVALEPKRRDTELYFYRSRWITALLKHDGITKMADIPELFAPHLNQVIPQDQLAARYEACERLIPTALYATWRAFLFDEPELLRYLEIARTHQARLVRDAARLIGELLGGRNELGTIKDVRGWLAELRALDLDPRRATARAHEAEVRAQADATRTQAVVAELERAEPAAWGDLAWRWLDDGVAHRALLAKLDGQDPTRAQIAELDGLRELGDDERARTLPRLAAALAPELEAVLVGSLVRGDDLAGALARGPSRAPAPDAAAPAEDRSPGWDAIDAALAPIYKDQQPKHYAAELPAMLGGRDPLQGISAYVRREPVPHFHFVTYGFTDLFHKETDDPDESGFGFELTLRLVRAPDDEDPPSWAMNFLQNLARYVFSSGNGFSPGHKMGLNGPIALGHATKITAVLFAKDPELGAIASPFGAAEFVQVVGITDDEYQLIQEWSTPGLVDVLRAKWPLLTTDLGRASVLEDPVIAAEVQRRVAAEGSSEELAFGGDLTISGGEGGRVTVQLGSLYAASLPRAMRGRVRLGRTYELRGRTANLHLQPGEASAVAIDDGGATLTLAPALVAELEATLRGARAGTYRFAAWDGLTIVVTPTFIRDQGGKATDVRGVDDKDEAARLIAAENARLDADADADADDEEDDEDDEDDDDDDDDDEEDDADADADGPPDPVRIHAALAMSARALTLAPDDDDTQFTHAMLLIDAEQAGSADAIDTLLGLLPTFGEHTRLNIATRMGKAEHPRFGEAVDLALGETLPERILAGSVTPAGDGGEISSFGDVAEEIYEELGEAILQHAPDRAARFVRMLPDSIPLLAKLAYHAAKSSQREQAIALYERVIALPIPDDGDDRTEYLRALNNLCIHLHAAGQLEAAARVADRAQPVARENPFIFHAAACAYVGIGDLKRAMTQVELAIEHAYPNLADLETDADLGPLRDTPEFQAAFRDWHAQQEGN